MNSIIEIIISGNTSGGTSGGTLNLYDNEPINLSYSINSIKDITVTTTPFSQTFVIPSTPYNDQLLSEIFYIGSDSSFDPRRKARAYILVNSIPIIIGNMQLLSISNNEMDRITYEVMIFGETNDFFTKIEGKYLEDLNWSDLNHILSISAITNSWTGTSALGYYYPLIDYGYGWTKLDLKYGFTGAPYKPVNPEQFFPATYTKTILDKIFSAAGFTYTSAFLSSSTIENTIIPFNGDPNKVVTSDFVSHRLFQAQQNTLFQPGLNQYNQTPHFDAASGAYYYETVEYGFPAALTYGGPPTTTTSTNFDNGNLYVTGNVVTNSYYSADTSSIQRFHCKAYIQVPSVATSDYAYNGGGFGINWPWAGQSVIIKFYRTYLGSTLPIDGAEFNLPINSFAYDTPIAIDFTTSWLSTTLNHQPLRPGEKVNCTISFRIYTLFPNPAIPIPNFSSTQQPVILLTAGTYWNNEIIASRVVGQEVDYKNFIPKKILQTDFVKSIINMFNLFVEPSSDKKNNLNIAPRTDYYATGTTKDWTTKLDLGKPVVQTLLSEQQSKKYVFSYKDDSDWLNTNYKNKVNQTYGQLIYDFVNDFTTDEKDISPIFSPTPVANVPGSTNIIIPQIYTLDSSNNWQTTQSNIRFLVKKPSPIPLNVYGEALNFNGDTGGVHWYNTVYPYAGHLDDPFNPTMDYNFGAVDWVYYSLPSITQNNLVNLYWKSFLDGISDKDARQIVAYFHLTESDISLFKFSDSIFVDGLTSDGGHWFIIDSIDYNPVDNSSSKVTLIKITEKPFVPGRSSGLGSDASQSELVVSMGNGQVMSPFSMSLGSNNIVYSPGSIAVGNNNVVNSFGTSILGYNNSLGTSSQNSFISGNNNTGVTNSSGNIVFGNGNSLGFNSQNNLFVGSNNKTNTGATSNFILGNSNTISSGVTGVTLLNVSNYTATTNDTTYTTNLTVVSAITLPGGVILSGGASNFCSTGLITGSISACTGGGELDLNYFGSPNWVVLSNDNGGEGVSYLQLTNSLTGEFLLSAPNNSSLYGDTTTVNMALGFGGINIKDNTTATTTSLANSFSTFVGTSGSSMDSGITNSVVVGGIGIHAISSSTVYTPSINIQTKKGISWGTGKTMVFREIPLGNWSMSATSSININHGLSATEWKTVRGMSCTIIDDASTFLSDSLWQVGVTYDRPSLQLTSVLFAIQVSTGGGYQSNGTFNATPFNRGWLNFWYTPD